MTFNDIKHEISCQLDAIEKALSAIAKKDYETGSTSNMAHYTIKDLEKICDSLYDMSGELNNYLEFYDDND